MGDKYDPNNPAMWQRYVTSTGPPIEARYYLYVPFWLLMTFAVVVASLPAATPWFSLHFSLRTLLIATTLVAVGLGLIAWLTK